MSTGKRGIRIEKPQTQTSDNAPVVEFKPRKIGIIYSAMLLLSYGMAGYGLFLVIAGR